MDTFGREIASPEPASACRSSARWALRLARAGRGDRRALTNSTAVANAVLWLVLYGGGFALGLLPPSFPSPDRELHRLPHVWHGEYTCASWAS
jgi:hypothetical protein